MEAVFWSIFISQTNRRFLLTFRNSKFLRSSVRRTIGDFGMPIAIFAMLGVDLAITDTYTQVSP